MSFFGASISVPSFESTSTCTFLYKHEQEATTVFYLTTDDFKTFRANFLDSIYVFRCTCDQTAAKASLSVTSGSIGLSGMTIYNQLPANDFHAFDIDGSLFDGRDENCHVSFEDWTPCDSSAGLSV
jgi:hypothetical protein